MVIGLTIYLHVLIRLWLEVFPLCVLHQILLHLRGVMEVLVLAVTVRVMDMNINIASDFTVHFILTLVFDLISILHGCRNLSLNLTGMARTPMLTELRNAWRSLKAVAM